MNSINFLSKIILVAIFSLALALTLSCSSDEGDDSFNENSPIFNYTGSGLIKIELDEDYLINAGNVTNGVVKLDLPKNIPDKYLRGFFDGEEDFEEGLTEEEIARACTNYSKYLKGTGGNFVLTSNSGDYIGDLAIVYEGERLYEGIIFTYFSKAGKITCNFERGEIRVFDIDAKPGWNRIYFHDNGDDNSSENKYSTKNILTKEKYLKWELYDH